jgi:hypothetical protein
VALNAWRHEWIRIAQASLEQNCPKVHNDLFGGAQKAGKTSVQIVITFLARFEKLASAKDAASRAAMARLQARGLTQERVAEARQLIAAFSRPVRPAPNNAEHRRAEIRKAEAALWSYYREWSQIARAVIKDVRLLKLLGYRDEQAPDTEDNAPATAPEQTNDTPDPITSKSPRSIKRATRKTATNRNQRKRSLRQASL